MKNENTDPEEVILVGVKMKKKIIDLIDNERSKFRASRVSWITQAVVEKLEKLGHEI